MRTSKVTPQNFLPHRNAVSYSGTPEEYEQGGFPWFTVASLLFKHVARPLAKRYLLPWVKRKLSGRGVDGSVYARGLLLPGQRMGRGMSDLPANLYSDMSGIVHIPSGRGMLGGEIQADEIKKLAEEKGKEIIEIANSATDTEDFVRRALQLKNQ